MIEKTVKHKVELSFLQITVITDPRGSGPCQGAGTRSQIRIGQTAIFVFFIMLNVLSLGLNSSSFSPFSLKFNRQNLFHHGNLCSAFILEYMACPSSCEYIFYLARPCSFCYVAIKHFLSYIVLWHFNCNWSQY